jgi:lysophospholipase L1-like esterase
MRWLTAASFLLASAVLWLGSAGASETSEQSPPKRLRIVLVGDSTVASFAKPPADRPTLTGWGQVLGDFFNEKVEIVNLARSGASSKSYLRLGLWQQAIDAKADYIIIQFGHNDQPGKGDRATNPNTEYRANLLRFIDEARKAGAKPVLVTPVARRTFHQQKIFSTLGPYAEAMIAVGNEKSVPVIDLHHASTAMFEKLGDEASNDMSPSTDDRSHFSRKGAVAMAGLVANALADQVSELKPYRK